MRRTDLRSSNRGRPGSRGGLFARGCLIAAVCAAPCLALSFGTSLGNHEWYAEFEDPYYIATGIYLSLRNRAMPAVDMEREFGVYGYLLRNIHAPNAFLLEVGGYPMQAAGAAVRYWAPNGYARAEVAGVNVVQALTRSINFPEPWSVSMFLGHVVKYVGNDSAFEGRGNAGLLCSYGNLHIKDNVVYPDHWGEFEVKLKVDKSGKTRRYATSYRIGARIHGNQDVKSIAYLGLRRERTDFKEEKFSLIRNTNFELRGDFSVAPAQFLRVSLEAGKKIPLATKRRTYALGVSLGFAFEANNPYRGALGEGFGVGAVSPIVNPLIRF